MDSQQMLPVTSSPATVHHAEQREQTKRSQQQPEATHAPRATQQHTVSHHGAANATRPNRMAGNLLCGGHAWRQPDTHDARLWPLPLLCSARLLCVRVARTIVRLVRGCVDASQRRSRHDGVEEREHGSGGGGEKEHCTGDWTAQCKPQRPQCHTNTPERSEHARSAGGRDQAPPPEERQATREAQSADTSCSVRGCCGG